MSDPKNPSIIRETHTPDASEDIVVSGDTAFVAGQSGLQIIDASALTEAVSMGVEHVASSAAKVSISGATAFVDSRSHWPTGWSGLQTIDVSDPKNPSVT